MTEHSTRSDAELIARAGVPSDDRPSPSTSASRWDVAAAVCSGLGLVLWSSVGFLLDPLDHSEQLANSIAALVNAIALAAIGGLGTAFLVVGWWLSGGRRGSGSPGDSSTVARRFTWFAIWAGMLTAPMVSGMYIPVTMTYFR